MAEGGTPSHKVPTTPKDLPDPNQSWQEFFGDSEEWQFFFQDIRQRHFAVLLQDGEDFIWMKRIVAGTQCPYWDTNAGTCKDPLNSKATCYNTGFLGGFNPPMEMKIAMPSTERQNLAQDQGLLKIEPMRNWTAWTPRLTDRDMVVRRTTGERFEVLKVQVVGRWRGLITAQFFDLRPLQIGVDFGMNVPVNIQI